MLMRSAIAQGLRAARANLRPGLLLWLVATLVVAAYYLPGGARPALESLAAFKQSWGYGFAVVSTALWGGVIPVLLTRLVIRDPGRRPRVVPLKMLFLTAFWGLKGAEVNLLYEWLARSFGSQANASTILCKVAIDQLLYGPLWAVPSLALAYLWMDEDFSLPRVRQALGHQFFQTTALPMLLANWGVWIPTVAAIYALPLGLQLPLQNLVLCLWSLILATMTGKRQPVVTSARD